jgi:ABC-type xylose transport system permease subunit
VSNLSWAPALIYTIGGLLVFFGVIALVLDAVQRVKAHNRQMRQAERRLGVMMDMKDLNS